MFKVSEIFFRMAGRTGNAGVSSDAGRGISPWFRRVRWVLGTSMSLALVSCQLVGPTLPAGADDPALAFQGRWDHSDPARPRASWPGFALECGFTGGSVAVRLDDPGNYYQVEIDGRIHGTVRGRPGGKPVLLAKGLDEGPHRLRLMRRNISFERPTTVEGFLLEPGGELRALPRPPRMKIEFIGDSYTAAEGNEATRASLPWREKYPVTHIGRGFAAMVAAACDAEHVTICRSGSGVLSDWLGGRTHPMTERYGWTLMEQPEPRWDFSRWTPDLVVICLGLNDYSGLRRPDGGVAAADAREFREAYGRLLDQVRRHAPDAGIVALAHFNPWVRDQIGRIVATRRAAGERRLHYAEFDEVPGGYVADGHPTVATHRKMADQILARLEEIGVITPSSGDTGNVSSRRGSAPRKGAN
jgi:hypothetical protein